MGKYDNEAPGLSTVFGDTELDQIADNSAPPNNAVYKTLLDLTPTELSEFGLWLRWFGGGSGSWKPLRTRERNVMVNGKITKDNDGVPETEIIPGDLPIWANESPKQVARRLGLSVETVQTCINERDAIRAKIAEGLNP